MSDTKGYSRLEDKLDRALEDLTSLKVGQAEVKGDLAEHMRRTEAAESSLALLREEFKPIQTHVAVVGAMAKIIAACASLMAIALGLAKLMGY